jgi:succinyl-CoA synthetase beta subunit
MEAIRMLENDSEVKSIFINIFGGILKCDKLATSIMRAAEEIQTKTPIILRLKGTNSDEAMKLIQGKEDELGIYFC